MEGADERQQAAEAAQSITWASARRVYLPPAAAAYAKQALGEGASLPVAVRAIRR